MSISVSSCADEAVAADDEGLAQVTGTPPGLVVALAFNQQGAAVLRDVGIEGTPGGRFRLVDLPPPPAELLAQADVLKDPIDDPPHLLARIAAVPRDHEPVMKDFLKGGSWHCDQNSNEEHRCIDETWLNYPDGRRAATVKLRCNIHQKDCTVTQIDGDLEAVRRSLRLLPGRVSDHSLLYLAGPAPAGSWVSQSYASGAALAAGYHLAQHRTASEPERARRKACFDGADEAVVAQYARELGRSFDSLVALIEHLLVTSFNAKHGTAITTVEDVKWDSPADEAVMAGVLHEVEKRRFTEVVAQQCELIAPSYVVVGSASARLLTITLAPEPPKVGDVFPDGSPWWQNRTANNWP